MDEVHYETPAEVAAALRRLAGDLYDRTKDRRWAEVVDALEHCALRIDDLAWKR